MRCPLCSITLLHHTLLDSQLPAYRCVRCGHCNGVWFDRAEWDVLMARNLHDKVNQFFTQPWQSRLRQEETRAALEALYLARLGREDYDRIKETRDWLMNSPQRAMLLAYLQASDPYKM